MAGVPNNYPVTFDMEQVARMFANEKRPFQIRVPATPEELARVQAEIAANPAPTSELAGARAKVMAPQEVLPGGDVTASDLTPLIPKAPPAAPAELGSYPTVDYNAPTKDFQPDLDAARENRNKAQLAANLGKAFTTSGAAITGSKPDYTFYDALEKQGGQQEQDVLHDEALSRLHAQAAKARESTDPASKSNRAAQDAFIRAFPDLTAKMGGEGAIRGMTRSMLDESFGMSDKAALRAETNRSNLVKEKEDNRHNMAAEAAAMKAAQNSGLRADSQQGRFDIMDHERLSKAVPAALARLKPKMQELDSLLGGIANDNGDIPGVGPVDRLTPDFFKTPQGQRVKQLTLGIIASLLQAQSGFTVTDNEAMRKAEEIGNARLQPDSMFKYGLRNVLAELRDEITHRQSGFRPEVVATYKARGGLMPEDFATYLTPPQSRGSAPRRVKMKDGSTWEECPRP